MCFYSDSTEFALLKAYFQDKGYDAVCFGNLTVGSISSNLQRINKPTIAIIIQDSSTPYIKLKDNPHVHIFRTSLDKSRMLPNEHVMPYIWETKTLLPPLSKGPKPRIAFCGWPNSHATRKQAIDICKASPDLECHFVLKSQFWGGKFGDPQLAQNFHDNMAQAEFNLCMRGAGNFSMRFYQTLSAGRIPALVNTDMPLPYADKIPWSDITVISARHQDLVPDIVRFWNEHNIEEVQAKCYQVFQEFFTLEKTGELMLGEVPSGIAPGG